MVVVEGLGNERCVFFFLWVCSIFQSGVVVISLFVLMERNEEDKTYSCFLFF